MKEPEQKLSHSLLKAVNNFRDKIHDEKKGKGIQNDGVWERAVAGYVRVVWEGLK